MCACFIADPDGDQMNLGFVQYTFTGPPHLVLQKPHGNSKSTTPYIRTSPSTLQKLKECAKSNSPKDAVQSVTKENGGITKAAAGDLPRNQKQVSNIRSQTKENDPLLSVMVMCKDSLGKSANPFVRLVTSAPEPMSILCTNDQLKDVVRFCTTNECSPLCVDPTFDLGDFSVTVSSYRHLLLQHTKKGKKSPVLLGPLLVHRRKDFSSYYFFASSLVSLEPSLIELRSFGTDGEEALFKAFTLQFQKAKHLRCFLHFRDNCMAKLRDLKVTNDVAVDVIQDILGCPLKGTHGLVGATSREEVYTKLDELCNKWNLIVPGFHEWFLKYKAEDLATSMTQDVRQLAGLGNPPEPFYTNEVESINRLIKRKVNYKATQWPDFCRQAKEIVEEQQNEVEKAVIGIGEYRLKPAYRHLEVPVHKWNTMTESQRTTHLCKLHQISMVEAVKKACRSSDSSSKSCSSSTSKSTSGTSSTEAFSLTASNQLSNSSTSNVNQSVENQPSEQPLFTIQDISFSTSECNLPRDILSGIFDKANRLVSDSTAIVSAPGKSTNVKMVESTSSSRPHMVTSNNKSVYSCDSDCGMWKCSKLCAHTVACAFLDNQLQAFLNSSKITKSSANFYSLSKFGTPVNPGKKPNKSRKASSKAATKAIQAATAESGVSMSYSEEQQPHLSIPYSQLPQAQSSSAPYYSPQTPASTPYSQMLASNYSPLPQAQNATLYSQTHASAPYSQFPQMQASWQAYPQQVQPSSVVSLFPFTLKLLNPRIKICQSCRIPFGSADQQAPYNVIISRRECRPYRGKDGNTKTPTSPSNSHYHANMNCLLATDPTFLPQNVCIPPDVLHSLSDAHKQHLQTSLGLYV